MPVEHNGILWHLRHARQENQLASQLRQRAGPELIEAVESWLLEKAYSVSTAPEEHVSQSFRSVNLSQEGVPAHLSAYLHSTASLIDFVHEYIDVIRFDFKLLGRSISIKQIPSQDRSRQLASQDNSRRLASQDTWCSRQSRPLVTLKPRGIKTALRNVGSLIALTCIGLDIRDEM